MSVSSLESIGNGLFLRVDILPGAEADGGDGGAGVEFECGHFRVFVYWVLLQLSLMVRVVVDIVWSRCFIAVFCGLIDVKLTRNHDVGMKTVRVDFVILLIEQLCDPEGF
jgi:hypothetical protein